MLLVRAAARAGAGTRAGRRLLIALRAAGLLVALRIARLLRGATAAGIVLVALTARFHVLFMGAALLADALLASRLLIAGLLITFLHGIGLLVRRRFAGLVRFVRVHDSFLCKWDTYA